MTVQAQWGGAPASIGTDPNPPRVDGQHAFVVALTFLVKHPDRPLILDRENAHYISRTACWWCRATSDDGTPCLGLPV
jgi:hypothetical protein